MFGIESMSLPFHNYSEALWINIRLSRNIVWVPNRIFGASFIVVFHWLELGFSIYSKSWLLPYLPSLFQSCIQSSIPESTQGDY